MKDILSIIWIFLPAGIANMSPVIANNIPVLRNLKTPLDFGKTFRGKRIFGDHKTFRGLFAGIIVGLLVAGLQMLLAKLFSWPKDLSLGLDYTSPVILIMGMVLGFGALAGDAIKSFFKRQINIEPGKPWVPFDQLDFLFGAILVSLLFFQLPIRLYVIGLLIGLFLHPTVNIIAWLLRLQDKPF